MAVAYAAVVSLMPILMTPYLGDDTFDRTPPQMVADPKVTHLGAFIDSTHAWMTQQGRFTPGNVALRDLAFTLFNSRVTYKFYLFILSLTLIVTIGLLVVRLTGRAIAFAPAVLLLCMTWSLRVWADALDTFHGVVPMAILLSSVSLLLVLSTSRKWLLGIAALSWSLALVTYEVAILLTPVFCLVVWLMRDQHRLATRVQQVLQQAIFVVPALVNGIFVLWLRSRIRVEPVPAYRVNLDVATVAGTYVKQFLAALPLSQSWYPGAGQFNIPLRLILLSLIFLGIPVAIGLVAARSTLQPPGWRGLAGMTSLGLGSWLASAVLVAMTLRWQNTLPAGQGYLSVVWGYVGVGLCATALWLALDKLSARRNGWKWRIAFYVWTTLIAGTVAMTFAANLMVASTFTFPNT
ncbi:MAG: hypothetical protein ABI899_11420 [Actinomycetota bacterium]